MHLNSDQQYSAFLGISIRVHCSITGGGWGGGGQYNIYGVLNQNSSYVFIHLISGFDKLF